jgi:tetratricopeptide (TPR) repeat protein
MDRSVDSRSPPIDFAVRFVEGRGLLGLRAATRLNGGAAGISIDRLELEIPNLRFPFDVSGDATRFQTRRCNLAGAELRLEERELAAWLASRGTLERFGLSHVSVRLTEGAVALSGRARVGERETAITARLRLHPGGQLLRVFVDEVRAYGFLPAPAPLFGVSLALGLGATSSDAELARPGPAALLHQDEPALVLDGIDRITLNPIELLLWRALPPAGWRLPRYRQTVLDDARVSPEGIVLSYGGTARTQPAGDVLATVHEKIGAADRLLARGDLLGALEAYAVAGVDELPPEVAVRISERRLAVLASMPARFDEALALGARLANEWPDRLFPLLAMAAVESERGEAAQAAARYARVVELADRQGEAADAREAALRAGEEYARAGDRAASPFLERVLQERPLQPAQSDRTVQRALQALAVRYTAEERWRELAQLEKRRLMLAESAPAEAEAHLRLGLLYLDRLSDAARARDELERAVRAGDGSSFPQGEAWSAYARALGALGEGVRAREALEKAASLSQDSQRSVEALLSAGELAEREGSLEAALSDVQKALERSPAHAVALERAASLLSRLGRMDEAMAAYEHAVEATRDDALRAPLLGELARLARDAQKDNHAARAYVERSLALKPTASALRLAAELAEVDGRKEELAELLTRLASTGDREAPLRLSRVLFELHRFTEAAQAAESAGPRPEALWLVAQARGALGQDELEKDALERLVGVSQDPEPRLRLGRRSSDEGELDLARRYLQEALAVLPPDDVARTRGALESLCDVLLRQGDDGALEATLGRLAELRADDKKAQGACWAAQGAARARLGLTVEAAESFRRALEADPEDAHARAGLAEAAYALKRWDEARAALEPLHAAGLPPRVERALRLGEIAERQSQPASAIIFYQAALEAGASGVDATRAWNALVALHNARGDHSAAARALLAAADDERTSETAQQRGGRLVHAADLLRKHAGQMVEAVEIYERALMLDPFQLAALDALEQIAERDGDVGAQVQVLQRKVAATGKQPHRQKAILGRLANLQAERLNRPDAAREAWTRALEIDPDYRPALAFLAAEARARGDHAEETRRLEQLTNLQPDPADPDTRTEQLVRLGQLRQLAGDAEAAEACARRVLEAQPRDGRALALLDELYTHAGRHADLIPVLALRAQVEREVEQIFDLLLRRASLLDAQGLRSEAIAAYEELTVLNPAHATAWARLAALLRAEQAWHRLSVVLSRMADRHAAEDRASEAEALYVEVAHLWHDRLNDPGRAREVLQRALELSPRSQLALSGLLALARQRKDAAEEDALLGRLVDIETEPRERAMAVAERARARQVRGDLEGAYQLLMEIPVEASPDLVLKLRIELAEARGQLADAAPVLEALRERAVSTRDIVTEKYAVRRLARLASERGPSPSTEDLLRRAVELDPDDRDAARALAQAERARGDDRAYLESLERLLRTARRTFEGAQREAELCVEMADVLRRLGDLAGAQARLRAALEATPDNGAAWKSLGLLERERGAHKDAAVALERAANLGTLDDAGWALLGDAWYDAGEFARAAEAFGRAGSLVTPRRRAETFERAGNEPEAVALWRQIAGEEGARQVARLERRRAERANAAGRTSEARVAAVEVLAADPTDEQALEWALQGLSPAATLALLDELAARIMPHDAAALFRRAATHFVDEDARVALSRAALLSPDAQTLVALADRESGVEAARRYQQALQIDPGCAQAALGLARVGLPQDAERALDASYDSVADGRTRARLSAALGQIRRDRLGDAAGAREAYQRAAAESSAADGEQRVEILRSLAELERVARDPSAAEEALETLRAEGHAADADLRHLAELYAERGAHAQAIDLLRGLTAPDASTPQLLLDCLEAAGQHAELLELLEKEAPRRMPEEARKLYQRAAAVAAGPLADPQKAALLLEKAVPLGPADAELWARLGRLYAGPLAEPDRAARCFARAYAADKSRADVIVPLADFHHELGEWEPSTDYYKLALERNAVPPDDLARVHLRLAEHARHRADAIAEEESLRHAVASGTPEIGDRAWKRLAALYRERGDRVRLATALKHLAERSSGADRVGYLREAVKLVAPDEAQAIDEEILIEDPADDTARERILGRLRAAGDQPLLLARLEREIPLAGAARQGALALEMGRLARTLNEDARATEAYRNALRAAPSLEAARGLMEVLSRSRREHEAAAALEASLFDARLAPSDRGEVARLTARAYLTPAPGSAPVEGGGSGGRALAFFERARTAGIALQMDPAAYRALLRAEVRFPELVQSLDQAAQETWDPDARLQLEIESADVLDKELGQQDEAARRYAGMLDKFPLRRDLAERARQLYAAAGEPIHALAALDKEMRLAPPEDLAQLKIVRGELLLSAGADAEAEAEFLHALITTPRVGRAHAALAEVYKRRGDVAGALEHLIAAADAPDLEPSRAAHCAVDAADVLLKEGDAGTAERLYQLAAALDPSDRDAIEGLARLAAARGDHEKHADLLGRAAMLAGDRRERAKLLFNRARLYQLELKRELEAYRCLKEAVANDPEHAEAARSLRELAEARGEWALAAEQLYREIAVTEEPVQRARLHVELGRLFEEKLLDSDEALRNYEQAAEIHVSVGNHHRPGRSGAPWHELVRLYTNSARLRDAATALDRLAETLTQPGESRERAEALQRAGELYERAGDANTAKLRLARAAAIGGDAGRRADDELLRLADQAGDPEELKRRIEERLAVEPEGPDRLALLRRLLQLAAHIGDGAEIDMRSQEVLARSPDDPVAFVERKRILEQRADEAGLAQLLRARAAAVPDAGERAERRFEAGRIAEKLGALNAAVTDYEEALAADPNHVAALDALADLTFRNRLWARARAIYAALGDRPSSLQRDALCQRRAEIAEECGLADEAMRLYFDATQANPSNLQAHEALARLHLGAGDERAAFSELKAVLDLLPLDAVDRITELRRQLGRLAVKLGETDQARTYFELVLAQDPARIDALEQLAVLYVDGQMWHEAAESYGRLSYLASDPSARADLLYRRGEILRLGLEDYEAATDSFLKAADLHPTHAPTLRRLVDYYYREGDFAQLGEVVRELESLPATLDESAVEAGLGICLGGDEARGTVIVAVSGPPPYRVGEALSLAKVRDVAQLDTAIRACTRALGGGDHGRQALLNALTEQVAARPSDLGARQALGRLHDLGGDVSRARMQYGVITFVDPLGPAGTRLRELPPAQPLRVSTEELVHPSARGPLRDALIALGPVVFGLPPAPLDADPAPSWAERLRPIARHFGVDQYQAAVVVDLLDPAWAEPTRPPRLFLARRALGDEAVARFAAARAFHALASGVPLVEGRAPDDVAALLRAAASMFLPDLAHTLQRAGAFVHAWQAELEALPLKPDLLPADVRNHLEVVLAAIVLDSVALTGSTAYCVAERLTADRVALALTGDLRAGLAALCPTDVTTSEARHAALTDHPPLAELLSFAARLQ